MKVSIIIPCYNAEPWLGAAIDSCLDQTGVDTEIIVVDDGSTDSSAIVAGTYGARIHHLTGPNRGGCHARNLGIAVATGDLVQFLDADDFLLPGKLAEQSAALADGSADIVVDRWQHQHHHKDGTVVKEPPSDIPAPTDMLVALLGGWWSALQSYLFTAGAVATVGAWNEKLRAAQDTDYLIRAAEAGLRFAHRPALTSIYRRHGPTVSTGDHGRYFDSHLEVLELAEARIRAGGELAPAVAAAFAKSYFQIARNSYASDHKRYADLIGRSRALAPGFVPDGSVGYRIAYRLLDPHNAERIAALIRGTR